MIGNLIPGLISLGVAPVTTSYESIATTTVGSGGSSTVTISSIPSDYTHLQLRVIAKVSTGVQGLIYRFNSDTGSNYSWHQTGGDGGSVFSEGYANFTFFRGAIVPSTANYFGVSIMDILDYKDTNKYKTSKILTGYDENGSGYAIIRSSSWRSTSAITSITITCDSGTISEYSQFALYGIKGS